MAFQVHISLRFVDTDSETYTEVKGFKELSERAKSHHLVSLVFGTANILVNQVMAAYLTWRYSGDLDNASQDLGLIERKSSKQD